VSGEVCMASQDLTVSNSWVFGALQKAKSRLESTCEG
jgi:hypothetical protein